MTSAIAIEDVRREVKLLKALSGHKHLVKFHDACEDANNVYIVMEYVIYLVSESSIMRLWCRIVRELNLCYVLFVHIFTKWAHRTTERGIGFLIPIAFCQLLRFISSL
jgi:serine/threonine protein kinase